MKRVLSIFLPTWEVDLFRRQNKSAAPSHDALPLLLFVTSARQEIVARCCRAASAAGVTCGMTLAEARMLTGPATIAPLDPAKSQASLHRLALWSLRFSPVVSPDPAADGLLLDITGEAHLFGGEHLLLTEIATWFKRLGLACRLAAAPTIGAAWAVARFGPHPIAVVPEEQVSEAVKPLPLAALRIDDETLQTLAQVGVECIAHLLPLSPESLRIRFGTDLLWRLDQLFGRRDEHITPVRQPQPLTLTRVFDGPTTQLESIMLATQQLLADLAARLLQKESGVRHLRLELTRAHAPPVWTEILLGRPSRNDKHLWSLLRPRVEPMNLGHGVEAITLIAPWVQIIRHMQNDAWGNQSHTRQQVEELLDTLTNRLTPQQVLQVRPHESHTPENAYAFTPVTQAPRPCSAILLPAQRPSCLLDPPETAEAIALLPDHRPASLRWRNQHHRLISGIGPERIVTPWWRDRPPQTRDYFKVQTAQGQWLWVYRHLETSHWFVHGLWS